MFVARLERVVTKDSVICDVPIEKGTLIQIPIHAIHHDEEVFPDPEIFDPDRSARIEFKAWRELPLIK